MKSQGDKGFFRLLGVEFVEGETFLIKERPLAKEFFKEMDKKTIDEGLLREICGKEVSTGTALSNKPYQFVDDLYLEGKASNSITALDDR